MMKLKQIISDLAYVRKSQGSYVALTQMLHILREYLCSHSNRVVLLSHILMEDTGQIQQSSFKNIVIRKATAQDLHLFRPIAKPAVIKRYETLLTKGRVCLVASKNEQIVAYTWFTSKTNPTIEHSFVPLSQGDVYIFAVNTPPTFRRQGMQFMLQQFTLGFLREEGYERALTLVHGDNIPSLHLFKKLGYEVISHLTRTTLFGVTWSRYVPNVLEKGENLITCFSYPILGYKKLDRTSKG